MVFVLAIIMNTNFAFASESRPVGSAQKESSTSGPGEILYYGSALLEYSNSATVELRVTDVESALYTWIQVANNRGCTYSVSVYKPGSSVGYFMGFFTGGDGYVRSSTNVGTLIPGTYRFVFTYVEGGNPFAGTAMVKFCKRQ